LLQSISVAGAERGEIDEDRLPRSSAGSRFAIGRANRDDAPSVA
jgi:hypothetical protein